MRAYIHSVCGQAAQTPYTCAHGEFCMQYRSRIYSNILLELPLCSILHQMRRWMPNNTTPINPAPSPQASLPSLCGLPSCGVPGLSPPHAQVRGRGPVALWLAPHSRHTNPRPPPVSRGTRCGFLGTLLPSSSFVMDTRAQT